MGSTLSKGCPCFHSRGKYDFPQKTVPLDNGKESPEKEVISNNQVMQNVTPDVNSQGHQGRLTVDRCPIGFDVKNKCSI